MPVHVNHTLTVDRILSRVGEIDIYQRYIGNVGLRQMINSPLRQDDDTPSFRLYVGSGGNVRFKDFGTGVTGGVFDLVSLLYPGLNFSEVLEKVWNEMNCHAQVDTVQVTYPKRAVSKPDLLVAKRRASVEDIAYWDENGITKDTLSRFRVSPISRFWIDRSLFICRSPSFAYDLLTEWKIYRPFEKRLRFISGGDTLQGYDLLPEKGEVCVIQKSYKDVMLLHEFGIPSFAPQAESVDVKQAIMDDVRERFEKVYIWGDPDSSGEAFMQRHVDEYDILPVVNDDGTKDITDHCKEFGKDSAKKMTIRLLKI